MSAKDLFSAIQNRDLSGVLDQMYAYRHPIDCACPECGLRERLSLEQRDEPRERGWEMVDDDSGQPTQGELP